MIEVMMNTSGILVMHKTRLFLTSIVRNYAAKPSGPAIMGLGKKSKKAAGAVVTKTPMEVETDTHKLVNFVCGTDFIKDTQPIPIKPDSEYPDWVSTLYTGPAKTLEQLEPGTKEYYEKLKRMNILKAIRLRKYKKVK